MGHYLHLADWRRRIGELYRDVRIAPEAGRVIAWQDWRARRNSLFSNHFQSPLPVEQRREFQGLKYYDYDPAMRVIGRIDSDVSEESILMNLGQDGEICLTRVALVNFQLGEVENQLNLFWITTYGGGLFLSFRDATNGDHTFGGGRYLYDTIKGADLGVGDREIVLDFNYAYNPSCAYHPQWVCPLPPRENYISFPVEAGELDFKLSRNEYSLD
jgi:uncharacterized protein (DUF1684 family)